MKFHYCPLITFIKKLFLEYDILYLDFGVIMEKNREKENSFELSDETQKDAKELIADAFRLFADHTKNLTDELTEFNKGRKEMRRRMRDGARRTSGRII